MLQILSKSNFNRRSQSFVISDLIMRIREDLVTRHNSFSKVIMYGPSSSLKIISSEFGSSHNENECIA